MFLPVCSSSSFPSLLLLLFLLLRFLFRLLSLLPLLLRCCRLVSVFIFSPSAVCFALCKLAPRFCINCKHVFAVVPKSDGSVAAVILHVSQAIIIFDTSRTALILFPTAPNPTSPVMPFLFFAQLLPQNLPY